jgi:hypothetical protein
MKSVGIIFHRCVRWFYPASPEVLLKYVQILKKSIVEIGGILRKNFVHPGRYYVSVLSRCNVCTAKNDLQFPRWMKILWAHLVGKPDSVSTVVGISPVRGLNGMMVCFKGQIIPGFLPSFDVAKGVLSLVGRWDDSIRRVKAVITQLDS